MFPFCPKMNPIQKLLQVMGRSNILSQPFRNHLSVESNFGVATVEKLSVYMVFLPQPPQFFLNKFTCFTKPSQIAEIR